jgi:hypothetical protein
MSGSQPGTGPAEPPRSDPDTTPLMQAALACAAMGVPVFPCSSRKAPCWKAEDGGRGFHDASTDPAEVRRLFGHPAAKLIGMRTGEASGLDVVDLDYRHGAKLFEEANFARWPETRVHETMSGGRHHIFRHAPGVRCSQGKVHPGVDVRADGGYGIIPPSPGYTVLSDAEPSEWPAWLLDLVLDAQADEAKEHRAENANTFYLPPSGKRLAGFVRAALDALKVEAVDGRKHDVLLNKAILLGGVQQQAGLSDGHLVAGRGRSGLRTGHCVSLAIVVAAHRHILTHMLREKNQRPRRTSRCRGWRLRTITISLPPGSRHATRRSGS